MPRARVAALVGWSWTVVLLAVVAALIAAWLAGWKLQAVETGSMDPALPTGSLAVVVPTRPETVEVGDVIAYREPADGRRVLHRVIGVTTSHTGEVFFETRGDANATPDPLLAPASAIQGRLAWHVPHLGRAATALRPPIGLLVLAGVPVLPLAVGEIYRRRRSLGRHAPRSSDAAEHEEGAGLPAAHGGVGESVSANAQA
jgi:signal peptidase